MSDLQRDLRSYGDRLADLVHEGAVEGRSRSPRKPRRAAVLAACVAILGLLAFAVASRNDPSEDLPSASRAVGDVASFEGVEIHVPSGWSAELSTNESGEVLYLRGERRGELHLVVRPVPSNPPVGDLGTISALGDPSAVLDEVEGGYALYADLGCPTTPCERLEVFGYDLSFDEFSAVTSDL